MADETKRAHVLVPEGFADLTPEQQEEVAAEIATAIQEALADEPDEPADAPDDEG